MIADAEARAAQIVSDAEAQAGEIRRRAESDAAQARERAEADARAQIEAAKRALDELGGTLVAAATEAIPKQESTPADPDAEPEPQPEPGPEPDPEPPAESPGAPEAPISPPAESEENGDDAAVRLVAMKLAVEGKDPAAIEAELIEKFGPGDRTDLLRDVVARSSR